MWWAKLLLFIFWCIGMILMVISVRYTYLYAKEEGYEYDFSPLFGIHGRKYMKQSFKVCEKDSYNKKMTRKTNLLFILSIAFIFIAKCTLELLGFL